MRRRDLPTALFASAATPALLPGSAAADPAPASGYPQTAAELQANVAAARLNLGYPPGDVRRYGAVGDGATDCTAAIVAATAVAAIARARVRFPAGTYVYVPTQPLEIAHGWEGESVESTMILCKPAGYAGELFRLTGSCEMRDLLIRTAGFTRKGVGVRISAPDPAGGAAPGFTGHVRLTRLWVQGFNTNVAVDRSFLVTLDQVRSEQGNFGFYCAQGTTSPGPNGYVTTHLHLGCYYGSNQVNVYYNTDVTSTNVTFIGGSSESASAPAGRPGTTYATYFCNIYNLHFIDWYGESEAAHAALVTGRTTVTFDGLYLNGTAGIFLGSHVQARFANVITTSPKDVLQGGDGTQKVLMQQCGWPAAGNSVAFASLIALQSTINGTFYENLLPSLRSGRGSPEGVVAADPGTLYTRTDGGKGTTLYVKESGSGSSGWAAK